MPNLFPTDYSSDVMSLADTKKNNSVGYKKSIFFDDETGDLSLDGSGNIRTASGIDAWKQWCCNCLDTDRYALPYSTDFGINKRLIFETYQFYGKSAAETTAQREITDALMADDYQRTESVSDFQFDWPAPDTMHITCIVSGIENAQISLSTTI